MVNCRIALNYPDSVVINLTHGRESHRLNRVEITHDTARPDRPVTTQNLEHIMAVPGAVAGQDKKIDSRKVPKHVQQAIVRRRPV